MDKIWVVIYVDGPKGATWEDFDTEQQAKDFIASLRPHQFLTKYSMKKTNVVSPKRRIRSAVFGAWRTVARIFA